jgi:hypothetical protein
MDFAQFLQQGTTHLRLPYFQGTRVCDREMTYRIRKTDGLTPGWYSFEQRGRYLDVIDRIEPEFDTEFLPRISGYLAGSRFHWNDGQDRLWMMPGDEEPELFAPISAAKLFDGSLMYQSVEFESEAELAVRQAFENETSIAKIKGVRPALAHAFLLKSTQRELAREAERRRIEEAAHQVRLAEMERWQRSLEGRISLALSHTGAELIAWRRTGGDQITVRYRIGGQRFGCVIDGETLQILDAGICLEGADLELSLSSLPSAVQEAIGTGQLYVFRRG